MSPKNNTIWSFVQEYSLLLVFGAFGALLWANINYDSYHHIVDMVLIDNFFIGHLHDGHPNTHFTLSYQRRFNGIVFCYCGQRSLGSDCFKIWFTTWQKSHDPINCDRRWNNRACGSLFAGAYLIGKLAILSNGWAIPIATDIAFSYLVGRIIFGAKHPAVGFLLLLAIADDAAGLVILAIFYPQGDLSPEWLAIISVCCDRRLVFFQLFA